MRAPPPFWSNETCLFLKRIEMRQHTQGARGARTQNAALFNVSFPHTHNTQQSSSRPPWFRLPPHPISLRALKNLAQVPFLRCLIAQLFLFLPPLSLPRCRHTYKHTHTAAKATGLFCAAQHRSTCTDPPSYSSSRSITHHNLSGPTSFPPLFCKPHAHTRPHEIVHATTITE
jgi:hypothetical protein